MELTELLSELLCTIDTVPVIELPHILAELHEAETAGLVRIMTPAPAYTYAEDRLLTVVQAAERLGTSEDWLYRNWGTLPFVHKYPFGLRFTESGLSAYIRKGQK
jgi:hypothetical protein